MKKTYDHKSDALYIELRKGRVHHTLEVTPYVLVDVTKSGRVVGIEVLDASSQATKLVAPAAKKKQSA